MVIKEKILQDMKRENVFVVLKSLFESSFEFKFLDFELANIHELLHLWEKCIKSNNPPDYFLVSGNANAVVIKDCSYCGDTHLKKKCPAYWKKCSRCEKPNHFFWKCMQKRVQNCAFCNGSHLEGINNCPARNNICINCNQRGHSQVMCRSRRRRR